MTYPYSTNSSILSKRS